MKRFLALLLVVSVAVIALVFEAQKQWEAPLDIPAKGMYLEIERGDSLRKVAENLHTAGVLKYPQLMLLYGRWTGLDQQIKRGEYQLPTAINARSLLLLLSQGTVIQHQVTFPEGITLDAAVQILAAKAELEHVLTGPGDPRILDLVKPYTNPEGWFYPDSYNFERGSTDLEVLQRAHFSMQKIVQQQWQQRSAKLPYDNAYEALIMASIIERETGLPSERGEIAGVFTRRLQQGMLLQTDPTVMYGLGSGFDGNLRRRHLRDSSNAYNTYRHKGLPPTPIALPGREAIHAALHPLSGKSLYFVARGDGGHYFSATLAEHNKAVRKYQLQRREDYRSSPPSTPPSSRQQE